MKTTNKPKAPHFVAALPENYREIYRIDAREKRFGIVMNAVALLVLAVVLAVAVPLIGPDRILADLQGSLGRTVVILLAFMVSMIAYIILHELVHGLCYHLLTHRKLTFGLSWSCAFCGVPDIWVTRRTALYALLAPFVTFTLLLLPLTIHPARYVYASCRSLFRLSSGIASRRMQRGSVCDVALAFPLPHKRPAYA